MYDYLIGKITSKVNNSKGCFVTLEVSGVGYLCEVSSRDYNEFNEEEAKIYTVLIHREDKMYLCGFKHKEARDIFNILTTVSGVGQKMALTLLDNFDTPELISYVTNNNYKALTSAKGVGPKLAQKIVLELKDKLINFGTSKKISIPAMPVDYRQAYDDTAAVLSSLGYSDSEITSAMSKVSQEFAGAAETEIILKKALQILST